MSQKRLVICGGGIAGLAAALCAEQAGFEPLVIEKAEALSEVGAGLQIGANAMKVLAGLGLDAAIEAAGHAPQSLDFRDGYNGKTIFSVPAGDAARQRWGAAHINIRRAALQQVLLSALRDRCPDAVKLEKAGVDYETGAEGVVVECEDGETFRGDGLIIADGVHSALRARFAGGETPDYTGHTALRVLVPATEALIKIVPDASTAWAGKTRHAVTYFLHGKSLVNFVGVVERPEPTPEGWHNDASLDKARTAFADFAAPVREVLEAATGVRAWGLYDRPAPTDLARGPVAMIGDAALPMPPFMAQGASFALECAWAAIASFKNASRFDAYSEDLRLRGARILDAARRNGDLFHGRGLPALMGYAPVKAAAKLLPPAITGRFDWIYGYDVTAGRALSS